MCYRAVSDLAAQVAGNCGVYVRVNVAFAAVSAGVFVCGAIVLGSARHVTAELWDINIRLLLGGFAVVMLSGIGIGIAQKHPLVARACALASVAFCALLAGKLGRDFSEVELLYRLRSVAVIACYGQNDRHPSDGRGPSQGWKSASGIYRVELADQRIPGGSVSHVPSGRELFFERRAGACDLWAGARAGGMFSYWVYSTKDDKFVLVD